LGKNTVDRSALMQKHLSNPKCIFWTLTISAFSIVQAPRRKHCYLD
jgi:hypothetical protein